MKLTLWEWILGGAISSPLLWKILKKILPFIKEEEEEEKKEKSKNNIPPFIGLIEELKDFFPSRHRKWYINFSRIFCPILYFGIQVYENTKSRPVFDSSWTPGIWAFIFFLVYVLIHLILRKKFKNGLLSRGEPFYIFFTLILFLAFTIFFTITVGELENHLSYHLIKGTITINNIEEKVTEKVKIVVSLEGIRDITYESEKNGKFLIFVKNDQYDRINTIQFRLKKEGKLFISTRSIEDLPINPPWEIILKEALNDNSIRGISE